LGLNPHASKEINKFDFFEFNGKRRFWPTGSGKFHLSILLALAGPLS
jgi:hypothetical protein